jgi:hypothetical protein
MDDDREARARALVRRTMRNAEALFSKEGNRRINRQLLERQEIEVVVAVARSGDAEAIEILKEYGRGADRARVLVPEDLVKFAWECFIYGEPKAKPGTKAKDTAWKFQTIALLVKVIIQEFGFPGYANAAHRGDPAGPMTACRVVAEEVGLSERTVEEIWTARKPGIMRTG